MSNEKHEGIHRLSSALIEKNPKVFRLLLFSSNSVKELVKKSKITGTIVHRFAPSQSHRKSGLLLNQLG